MPECVHAVVWEPVGATVEYFTDGSCPAVILVICDVENCEEPEDETECTSGACFEATFGIEEVDSSPSGVILAANCDDSFVFHSAADSGGGLIESATGGDGASVFII